jgi:hypothetical protein
VTINSGYGNPNFTITNGQVAWEGDEEFAGWLGTVHRSSSPVEDMY